MRNVLISQKLYQVIKCSLDGVTVNTPASCAEGLEFKSRADQIWHRLRMVCTVTTSTALTRYTYRRNTASIMKRLVWLIKIMYQI